MLVWCSSVAQNHLFMFPIELLQLGVTIVQLYRIFETHKLLFRLFLAKAISSVIFVVDLNEKLVRYQFRCQVSTNCRKGGFFSASVGRQHFAKAASVHCHYRKYWSNLTDRRLSIKCCPTYNRNNCHRQSLRVWLVDNQMNQSGREATRVAGTKRGKYDIIQPFLSMSNTNFIFAIFIVSI